MSNYCDMCGGYDGAHLKSCDNVTSKGSSAPTCSNRFMKLDDFCDLLASIGVVDECAIHDPEGYDGGATLNKVCAAFYEIDNRLIQNEKS